jgi:tetratricopeptide (TPR) repeat protein
MSAQEPAENQRAQLQYLAAVKNFEVGLRHLQKQNYEKSKEIFEKLASGSAHEVANRARVYLRMCERKLSRAGSLPKTAADYYDLGVAQLNARNLDSAIQYLSKADRLGPNQDHVQYALAAAHTLLGNVEAALGHLKSAIALRRANRFLACKDEDFQSLVDDPRFRRLLRSEAT